MSAFQQEVIGATTLTADGQSQAIPVPTLMMLAVCADVTAITDTSPEFTLWLQASDDGGTTWYDFPYDLLLASSAAATDVAADTQKRNVCDEITAGGRFVAIYKHVPAKLVRLAYIVAGTNPEVDLSVTLVGK